MRKKERKHADVIIVGAGSLGCNAAWHLHRRGRRVLVVEASPTPAHQTTRGAAGFVGCLSGVHKPAWGGDLAEMGNYGIDFYTKLAGRCGTDIGFGQVGISYLFLTSQGWSDCQSSIEKSREYGVPVEILTRQRAAELLPVIQFSNTKGIVFIRNGIRVRAADAISALARELAGDGVQFVYNTKVTGFLTDANRVAGVTTQDGELRGDSVLVAAGAWGRPLLETIGVSCPATPLIETRFTTRPLKGITGNMPMLIFRDWQRFYIREERGGLLIGGGDHLPTDTDRFVDPSSPPRTERIPYDQANRILGLLHQIEHVMPILKGLEVDQVVSGLPTFTEDGMFILSDVPGFQSLYIMAGCQEAGINQGPAFGRFMAELITGDRASWDSAPYRLGRFAHTQLTTPTQEVE